MADVGEPFCAADVCEGEWPDKRFISAHQSGCNLTITYEQRQPAYDDGDPIRLREIGSDWVVLPGSDYPYDAPK
jgi:hypothetical protein